jgi:hypothetical protein
MYKNCDNHRNSYTEYFEESRPFIMNGKYTPPIIHSEMSQWVIQNQHLDTEQESTVIFLDEELDYYPDIYGLDIESKKL